MTAPEILCLGEALVEFVREGPEGESYRRGFGGDTSNAAIAAARQGARVGYVSAVGADRFGEALMGLWADEGVSTAGVKRAADAPTGIYFVDPDPTERHFTYYRAGSAASRLRPADLSEALLADAKVLHLSGITLAVSDDLRETAFAAMRLAGGDVSLDTNLRLALWSAETACGVLEKAMGLAQVVVTSIDDAAELWGAAGADAVIDRIQALGPETVLVTQGAEGCRIAVGDRRETAPAHLTQAVDSTGAGDSFAGAFHAWRLELGDPFEAARRAAVVAAGTVSGLGAIAPIPRRAEVLAALAA